MGGKFLRATLLSPQQQLKEFPMAVQKEVNVKFINNRMKFDATFEFGWLTIKIDADVEPSNAAELTAEQIQQLPIRAAIKQLQSLLPADPEI